MILILDANAVIPNSELTGVTWAEISAAINEDVLKLIVPTIVVAEITGRVRANRRSQRPRTDGIHGVPQTVQDAIRAARDEVENWAAGYDAAAVLAAAGAVEWTVPTVGHDVVSRRAIDRLPPFNGNGGGYRDTLHWYTVLEVIAANPDEDIVLVTNDNGFKNKTLDDLHEHLRTEAEAALEAGSITLVQDIKDFVPPRKFASNEIRAFLDDDHIHKLMTALFPGGKLHASELWQALELDDPVDAEVTDPDEPEVLFSYVRDLVDGGEWYRTRLRLTARVVFDWVDWTSDADAEGSEERLDLTAWYTVNDDGFHLDEARTDLQPAPIYTAPQLDFLDPAVTRGLTSSAFSIWKNQRFTDAVLAAQSGFLPKNALGTTAGITIGEIVKRGLGPNFSLGSETSRRAAENAGIGSIGQEISRRTAAQAGLGSIAAEISRRTAANSGMGSIAAEIARRSALGTNPAWTGLSDAARGAARGQLDEDSAGNEQPDESVRKGAEAHQHSDTERSGGSPRSDGAASEDDAPSE